MNTRQVILVALVLAVMLTPVAAADPVATKQRVAISSKLAPGGTFLFAPVTAGALQRDSGTVSVVDGPVREVMRDGQKISIRPRAILTFTGELGSFSIRERNEWAAVSNVNTRYGYPPGVALGTWSFVRGTGQYARVTGRGRSAHAGFGTPWLARHEGFLSSP